MINWVRCESYFNRDEAPTRDAIFVDIFKEINRTDADTELFVLSAKYHKIQLLKLFRAINLLRWVAGVPYDAFALNVKLTPNKAYDLLQGTTDTTLAQMIMLACHFKADLTQLNRRNPSAKQIYAFDYPYLRDLTSIYNKIFVTEMLVDDALHEAAQFVPVDLYTTPYIVCMKGLERVDFLSRAVAEKMPPIAYVKNLDAEASDIKSLDRSEINIFGTSDQVERVLAKVQRGAREAAPLAAKLNAERVAEFRTSVGEHGEAKAIVFDGKPRTVDELTAADLDAWAEREEQQNQKQKDDKLLHEIAEGKGTTNKMLIVLARAVLEQRMSNSATATAVVTQDGRITTVENSIATLCNTVAANNTKLDKFAGRINWLLVILIVDAIIISTLLIIYYNLFK